MARSTKTQKALNLNAAHGLLSPGSSVAEAATILAQERGISLRQAYRYLHGARALGRATPVGEPSVPGDVQNSSRRARAITCIFQAQRFAAERDCHRGDRDAFDRNTSARKTWLSALQSVPPFVWNLLPIACSFALQQGFSVPDEWVIEDEGYSGATLVRPDLGKGSRFGG
ncbi:hypothetical protein LRP30_31990 [Bradyrhizobium sp. C-145]|uniref:hypothetical protein n=1 Tax=Bradyrhizobium sp. C-145 TaxID=574727 RepID=UPI00201B4F86|nr:hypothetical protein [Bradyrhizobium sp. C-145]UQR61474.1 hypothetical protein LRP30_31990 [Bradyrhizobium sp. C-145]